MANTGIRPSEAKQLRWRHVDLKDKLIKLDATITKNKKPREVVGRDPAITRMTAIRRRQTAFLKLHGQSIKPSDFVFSLPRSSGGTVRLEEARAVRTAIRDTGKRHCGNVSNARDGP
jgi:integrase